MTPSQCPQAESALYRLAWVSGRCFCTGIDYTCLDRWWRGGPLASDTVPASLDPPCRDRQLALPCPHCTFRATLHFSVGGGVSVPSSFDRQPFVLANLQARRASLRDTCRTHRG